ncbi:uncharacterized protein A1O9_03774 [Exophiala aquamarina CBS 119918]|uniref:Major facilitator superfamily (MFS) profile domain-containing protein n=1 Tax=Exophiala aquamarina CBS 119918 TaxID=1182545 RepID=A0A072PGE6_9EURO|nr:uncharacterized protein A1O9_03774 [Exophiala aquamarina CBS 119918]KEF58931.1 hypothetical protein A1O9_03774 [Exophiala aquamarina CBS 119918]
MVHKEEDMWRAQPEERVRNRNVDLGLSEKDIGPSQGDPSPGAESDDPAPFLVAFDEPHDHLNPKDWPTIRKWVATGVLSVTGFNRIMVSTIMAPALSTIAVELDMNATTSVMSLSVYLLATAFGPLLIGPLSEIYGRKPVLHATNTWFLVWNLVCGFATSKSVLIAARLLAGLGASAIYTLGGGVLGDVWRPEERGRSLGLYQLIPLLGAAVGPILGGFIASSTTWRWMFWSTSIFQLVATVLSFFIFHETYAHAILKQKASRLRRSTGDARYHAAVEKLLENRPLSWMWRKSLSRPLRLLMFHSIVQIQAVVCGFAYGITYLVISSYADMWTARYAESTSRAGLHYLAMCLGEILGSQLGGPAMDLVFHKLKMRHRGSGAPELHLPLMVPGSLITVTGFLLYGWTAQTRSFWVVVDLGALLLSLGNSMTGQVMQAYVIDSYPDHTSSALAASQLVRSLTAFGFPLFAPHLYAALGYGWGNSLLALISAVIGFPAPLVLWVFGARLREEAQFTF